jgi:hypothetical protein
MLFDEKFNMYMLMPNIYSLTYWVHGVLAKENLELPKLHNPQNIKVDALFLYPIAGECLPPPPPPPPILL